MSGSGSGDRERPSDLAGTRLSGELALERKGEDVAILDLRGFEIGCDFFVMVSGRTETHVRDIADHIVDELARRLRARPWHIEGRAYGRWILLDYVHWVVHIFHHEAREYYQLEHLWGDAPIERLIDAQAAPADAAE
ncbi:MAG: ribosome silencing factor [Candidatus Eisenbacteria bacterium]